jgi:crotonobetainyl-CoA:carnitine CoA-transferase CaiB-like acyl-CoA transferase
MTDIMKGLRILEVAEHTFVPAASAILADWGAEVIKVEHVERGDASADSHRAPSCRSEAMSTSFGAFQ